MINLVYTGPDMESYMLPLELVDTYDPTKPPTAALGWRTIVRPAEGPFDPPHLAKGYGSVQIVVRGAVKVGVTAGEFREWTARPGDAFIFIDLVGKGHFAQRVGRDQFEAINIRLSDDWEGLKAGFTNWPEEALPFPADVKI